MNRQLPVVVIGAGPIGLAAAAHLLARGMQPLVLEAGPSAGAGIGRWKQVKMFSPWHYSIDAAAAELLSQTDWVPPPADAYPTGAELVTEYLQPLAAVKAIADALRLNARVTAVSRQQRDLMSDSDRSNLPFVVRYVDTHGEHDVLARAVVDASGTIEQPNPLGGSGIRALGESAAAERIYYGIPDVANGLRERYEGKRVLVVGSGHSAFNVLADLTDLAESNPATRVHWALRRPAIERVLGGGENDQLIERGKLGMRIAALIESGLVQLHSGFSLQRIERRPGSLTVHGLDRSLQEVDEIIACTGFRPDLNLLSEVRLDLDPATQSPRALAPLIDPNQHSCGSVRAHGAVELKQPERDLYIVGMKSYGRAPTFLLATGYEQVRSVVAAIDGDWQAARRVELLLPETGVCITQFSSSAGADKAVPASCCGNNSNDCACGPRTTQAKPSKAASCCG